jgi:hypothetical protein
MRKPTEYVSDYQGKVTPDLVDAIAKAQKEAYAAGLEAGRVEGMSEFMTLAEDSDTRMADFLSLDYPRL